MGAGGLAMVNPPPHAELTNAPTLGVASPATPSRLPLTATPSRREGSWSLAPPTAGRDRWTGEAHRGGGARCVSSPVSLVTIGLPLVCLA